MLVTALGTAGKRRRARASAEKTGIRPLIEGTRLPSQLIVTPSPRGDLRRVLPAPMIALPRRRAVTTGALATNAPALARVRCESRSPVEATDHKRGPGTGTGFGEVRLSVMK